MKIELRQSEERFETEIQGQTAFLTFSRSGGLIEILHTDVPAEISGRGIGSALVREAFDYARGQGLEVVPLCPFARSWVDENPDYRPLVRSG